MQDWPKTSATCSGGPITITPTLQMKKLRCIENMTSLQDCCFFFFFFSSLWEPRTSLRCQDALPRWGRKQNPGDSPVKNERKPRWVGKQTPRRERRRNMGGDGVGLCRRPVRAGPRALSSPLTHSRGENPRLPGRHHPPAGRGEGPPPPGCPIRRTPSLMGEAARAEGSQAFPEGAPHPRPAPARRPTAHRPPPPSLISTDARRPPLGFRWLQNLKVKS